MAAPEGIHGPHGLQHHGRGGGNRLLNQQWVSNYQQQEVLCHHSDLFCETPISVPTMKGHFQSHADNMCYSQSKQHTANLPVNRDHALNTVLICVSRYVTRKVYTLLNISRWKHKCQESTIAQSQTVKKYHVKKNVVPHNYLDEYFEWLIKSSALLKLWSHVQYTCMYTAYTRFVHSVHKRWEQTKQGSCYFLYSVLQESDTGCLLLHCFEGKFQKCVFLGEHQCECTDFY